MYQSKFPSPHTPHYRYFFNGQEADNEVYGEGAVLGYEFRQYDSRLSRWWSIDPLADKYPGVGPYAFCNGSPILLMDPSGEEISEHVDKKGRIIAHYNDGDNSVYLHKAGVTKSDIDSERSSLHNTAGNGVKIGEIGGVIDISETYSNLLKENAALAKKMNNPFKFRNLVKNHGDWDLKNNPHYIYGLGNDRKTQFSFNGQIMDAQDIGNHHFGVVAFSFGFDEEFALRQAGAAQISSGTSLPQWRVYENPSTNYPPDDLLIISIPKMLPPYGDDPRDQNWIKLGYKYARTH